MANLDPLQILAGGNTDPSVPQAGDYPQPGAPQQFPLNNPILTAAQRIGGALQGNPNVQGGPPVSPGDMLPSIPRNKLEALAMLAGPALGMAAGKASKALSLMDSGQKNPLGSIIYRLMDGKKILPFFGTAEELQGTAQKMGRPLSMPQQDIDAFQRYGSGETPEISRYLGHDAQTRILNTVNQLEPNGAPISTSRLRQALPDLSKEDFDKAALELQQKEKAFLSLHHAPWQLPESERAKLIEDTRSVPAAIDTSGLPRYYVAITPRR